MMDVKKMRQIYDKVEIHVRGLQALGVGTEQYGTLLIPIMMSKNYVLSSADNSTETIGI